MSRDIKFRAFDDSVSKMIEWGELCKMDSGHSSYYGIIDILQGNDHHFHLMQFTGLSDKKKFLTEVFEGDIIGENGLIQGNQHENPSLLKDKTNLLIPRITSKDWKTAYKQAMARGCQHTE